MLHLKFTTEWKLSFRIIKVTDMEQSNNQRLLTSLGLCARARGLIFGVPMICDGLRRGGKNAPLIVLEAADTSENTHKRLTDKCSYYNTRHVRLLCTGEELAAALGKSAVLGAVALTDANQVRLIEKYI